jgi:hypothetical protein
MSLSGKLETASNISTIIVAIVLSTALVKLYFLPARSSPSRTAPTTPAEITAGANLKSRLPGIDWSKNGRTLVLAISTSCHFCKDSEPFYRRIQQEAGSGTKMVAVLPQSAPDAERYLNAAGIKPDQVKQVPLGAIGVRGTPTLLLVDDRGQIRGSWYGKLSPEAEEDVLSALRSSGKKG